MARMRRELHRRFLKKATYTCPNLEHTSPNETTRHATCPHRLQSRRHITWGISLAVQTRQTLRHIPRVA